MDSPPSPKSAAAWSWPRKKQQPKESGHRSRRSPTIWTESKSFPAPTKSRVSRERRTKSRTNMEAMTDTKCDGEPIVLIIDDDSDFRALIRSYLGSEGYRVIDVDDGAKADAKLCSGCALIMVDL